jgi:cellulose synthase operon protein B
VEFSRAIRELTAAAQRRLTARADEANSRPQRLRWRDYMKPSICCAAVAVLFVFVIEAVSAQQSPEAQPGAHLPMILSPAPRSPGVTAAPPPNVELPATIPAIPSGVAIPPSDAQEQRPPGQPAPSLGTAVPPVTAPPLPKTTPLPPPAVATSPGPPAQSAQPTQAVSPPQSTPPPRSSQAPTPAPLPEQRIFPPPVRAQTLPAPYPILIGAAETGQQMIRLADMGRPDGVRLEGTSTEGSVSFSTRQDDTFISARISLVLNYSAAVGRDDGELSVYLNNEFLGSSELGKKVGAKLHLEFSFNPAFLTTENRLTIKFALKGQGASACRVARDKTFWVKIEPASFVYLSSTRLPLADELATLPRPFFDPTDPLSLTLPFVLPLGPEPEVMQAAGIVAGYFGLLAQYKGATFPVVFNGVPAGNAVVLVQGDHYPAGIASIPGEGPRVAIITNPSQVDSKLLLIIGANAEELQTAAATLALGTSRLSGGWSEAREGLRPLRKPYDAPAWISTDHPVRLGDLTSPAALNGLRIADAPQVSFRTAPDLFFGALSGGSLYLRLRRADDSWIDAGASRVFIDLNGRSVGEVPMEAKLKVLSRLKEWLFPGKADDRVSPVILPGYQLFSANRLVFNFDLRAKPTADCDALEWSDRTGIDPDSVIDLTRVAHFAAFPNLALFANSGFPFTRLADLSDTAFVLPKAPSTDEVQAFLNMLGQIADATGLPATRFVVTSAEQVNSVADRNLIVIGLVSSQPLLRQWDTYNSIRISGTGILTAPRLNFLQRLVQPFDPRAPSFSEAAVELAKASLGKPYAYLSSYWSPLDANRIVVAVGATDGTALVELTKQMGDPDLASRIQGDFFFLSGGKGEYFTSGRRTFVGILPIWWKIQWLVGSFGLAAFACVIFAIVFLAAAIHRFAPYQANRRLRVRNRMP